MGAGRPRKFENVEELEKLINEYFNSITITYPLFDTVADSEDDEGKKKYKKIPRLNNAGKQVEYTEYYENPSITKLCKYIGICKDTWNEYSRIEEFSDSIKRAKERIESYLEDQLYRKDQVTGIIFNLKNNFGWKDKSEVEHSGETNVNVTSMTVAERKTRIDELKKKLVNNDN